MSVKCTQWSAINAGLMFCLVAGFLSACANIPGKTEEMKNDEHEKRQQAGYAEHQKRVATCQFGSDNSKLYPGFAVENHILAASEQGNVENFAPGGAKDDFRLNFLRIFNCYRKYKERPSSKIGSNEAPSKQVLISLNGGLSPASEVRKLAASLVPQMLKDGYYPVFLIWPTGPLDTYFEQILNVRNVVRGDANYLTAPLYLVGDIGQGLARAPVNFVNQVRRFAGTRLVSDSHHNQREYFLTRRVCRSEDDCDKTDLEKFEIEGGKVTAKKNLLTAKEPDSEPDLQLLEAAAYGSTFPVRFVSTPLIDAFGKTMWENMVRRTRTTIRRPIEFNIHALATKGKKLAVTIDSDKQLFPNGLGAFARFFTMLQYCSGPTKIFRQNPHLDADCYKQADEEVRNIWREAELTVIGHSMGTIVMNEVIPQHPDLPYRNLVFMGAAASIRDTARAMAPLLEQSRDGRLRFYNLMLHPQNDARELVKYGAAPSGSLLAWIDEMFEGPKTHMDRTMGKWRNIRATKHVFSQEAQSNMLLRVFSWDGHWANNHGDSPACQGAGDSCPSDARACSFKIPTTHGDFNDLDARFWCPFFWGADKVGWWGEGSKWKPAVCGLCPDKEDDPHSG